MSILRKHRPMLEVSALFRASSRVLAIAIATGHCEALSYRARSCSSNTGIPTCHVRPQAHECFSCDIAHRRPLRRLGSVQAKSSPIQLDSFADVPSPFNVPSSHRPSRSALAHTSPARKEGTRHVPTPPSSQFLDAVAIRLTRSKQRLYRLFLCTSLRSQQALPIKDRHVQRAHLHLIFRERPLSLSTLHAQHDAGIWPRYAPLA